MYSSNQRTYHTMTGAPQGAIYLFPAGAAANAYLEMAARVGRYDLQFMSIGGLHGALTRGLVDKKDTLVIDPACNVDLELVRALQARAAQS